MNIFGIIAHVGLLLAIGRDLQAIVNNLVQKKESFPSEAEFLKLLDDAIELISSGLINLPADTAKQISDALVGAKASLSAPKVS